MTEFVFSSKVFSGKAHQIFVTLFIQWLRPFLERYFTKTKLSSFTHLHVILKPFDWYKIILIFLVDCLDCLIQMCGQKTHLDISQNNI